LKVDNDETAKPAMIEKQVNPVPLVSDPKPALAAHEGKFVPEFKQEVFQAPNERFLQDIFGVLVFETEEFQDQGVLDLLLWRHIVSV
jgi:hypothetical protein